MDDELDEVLEDLDAGSCARLLEATHVGRMAVVDENGRPRIVVLNHLVHEGDIFFRTAEEAWLTRHLEGDGFDVVYEVDSFSHSSRTGWSVIAAGRLRIEQDANLIALAHRQLEAWARGHRDVVLHLDVDVLTGRRVGLI
ncbi:MAG: pyridoxamine 5'-phosphate oxidase family protein [Kineosporiaceae bacterium]|nr:pyridoxamine 5'-phosphate oxidase family protein [Kineosporiaceae bacterium]